MREETTVQEENGKEKKKTMGGEINEDMRKIMGMRGQKEKRKGQRREATGSEKRDWEKLERSQKTKERRGENEVYKLYREMVE